MTQFQPGSPDDVAWTMFASKQSVVLNPEEAARKTDAMMAERAKRLTTPAPADDRPKWRCETCKHWTANFNHAHFGRCHLTPMSAAGDNLCSDFGCPQWEGKEGA